jgi:hypothetical protein
MVYRKCTARRAATSPRAGGSDIVDARLLLARFLFAHGIARYVELVAWPQYVARPWVRPAGKMGEKSLEIGRVFDFVSHNVS